MKKALTTIGLLFLTLVLNSCVWERSVSLSIISFSLTNESVKQVVGPSWQPPISISVSYEVLNENNQVSKVFLVNGQMVDRELKLDRKVSEPTEVVISVSGGSTDRSAETSAVLSPDSTVKFDVIHKVTNNSGYFIVQIKGRDHRSIKDLLKFSVKGNLSQLVYFDPTLDFEPNLVQVRLIAEPTFPDYSNPAFEFDPVLVDDGEFSIEGDLDEPTLFTIVISQAPHRYHIGAQSLPVILEPGVNYRVVPLGNEGRYAVVADRDSLHSKLISSWQFDPEYITLADRFVDDVLDWRLGLERAAEKEHYKEQFRHYQVAEQCDHVRLSDEEMKRYAEPYRYATFTTSDELAKIRTETLLPHLRTAQDPEITRLIVDLMWTQLGRDWTFNREDEKVEILEEFAQKMDVEFVAQHITPRINSLKRRAMFSEKLDSVIPGRVAPQFTLTSVVGDEISLKEVLNKNELVLVDFWASDCFECIPMMITLKELYAEYEDQGFEIVTISIDDNVAEWENTSDELNLPWINLRDAKDDATNSRASSIHVEYGVFNVPSDAILVDKDGCIIQKRFSLNQLKESLSTKLAEIAN